MLQPGHVDPAGRAGETLQRRLDVEGVLRLAEWQLLARWPVAAALRCEREVLVAEQGRDLDRGGRLVAEVHAAGGEGEVDPHVRAFESDAGDLADGDAADHDLVALAQ